MKEMIYQAERKREMLDTGYCLGLLYYIMNLGTHPTAYVKIPENHKYYKKDMEKIDIYVHGGITYSNDYLYIENNQKIEGWFIGWDYIHYGDYAGYEEKIATIYEKIEKTLQNEVVKEEEFFKDVKAVCYQLQKIKEE